MGSSSRRLLLASTSKVHGSGYLDHLEPHLVELFAGVDRVLFVPWALHDLDGYTGEARQRLAALGIGVDGVHQAPDPVAAVERAAALFIGGGNTFRLLDRLLRAQLIEPIRRRVASGMPYLGTSAGSNVAGPTIRTTNDMPIVHPASFAALGLVEFQINPHYIDADPSSTHMGETRDMRLQQFHEENDTPVVALREGTLL
ncbi:MAG: dipeptidase PepE, partial [Thermoanaerobaculia bacterium]